MILFKEGLSLTFGTLGDQITIPRVSTRYNMKVRPKTVI